MKYGAHPEDIGLLVSMLELTTVGILESKSGVGLGEIETELVSVLEGNVSYGPNTKDNS